MTADHSTRATIRVLDILFDRHAHTTVDVRNASHVSETTVRDHLEMLTDHALLTHTEGIPHAYFWNPEMPAKRATRKFAADLYSLVDAWTGNGLQHRDAMLRALRAVAQNPVPASSRTPTTPIRRSKGKGAT